jgi:hypothetical protein
MVDGEECTCGGLRECVQPALLGKFTAAVVGDAFACAKKERGVRVRFARMKGWVGKAFCSCAAADICAVIERWEGIPASNSQRGAGRADMVRRFAEQVEAAAAGSEEQLGQSLSQDAPAHSNEKEAAEKAARKQFFSQPCQEVELVLQRIAEGLGPFGEQRTQDANEVGEADSRSRIDALRQACTRRLFACTVEGNKVLVIDGECEEKCFRAEASCLVGNRLAPDAGPRPEHFVLQPLSVNRAQVNRCELEIKTARNISKTHAKA